MSGEATGAAVAAVCGALAGAGLWLTLLALASAPPSTRRNRLSPRTLLLGRRRPLRLVLAVAAGLLVWTVTGWPVAGVLAGLGAWWLPGVLGPDRDYDTHVAGVEAVAAWAEMLRDLMAGASGLHQAIASTVPIAPESIREEVARLAEALRQGRPPQQALTDFADEVDNPIADLVAAALTTAASRHATDLGVLLGTLAEAAREQAAMLVRVAAGRSRVRTSTRIIIAVTLGTAAALLLFSPDYLEPFDTLLGQLVLAAIGGVWAAALTWMVRLSRPRQGPRVLAPQDPAAIGETAEVSA
ncbi:type II secretion system F family protein [Streptomonospora wellingtoniae]|uniref:Type II secretion protein F n=1 Tax=Streptomonospora wellingtoniae TaxID=3075544 RepID=A0ABU2KWI4_9ACTN|nr:type II secretion system F family protein [Streptomonospora sp. DSM 45055]MDT0303618.1 type II secretion protein F [Streptomonospora sp. DSM 45055]